MDAVTPLDDAQLRDAIRQRVEAAGTSFYWAMRLLPAPRRDAMYAIYAFCREVDDIADDWPPAERAAGLAAWRREIDALYAGRPQHPVGRALHEPVARFALRREDFEAVIDGMEMDAASDIRAPDLATLDLYCARVAAAVGHLSVHAFGDPSPAAHRVADALGRALQLTNILRDLDEDAGRGRLYLPREVLDRHGIRDVEPRAVLRHPALPAACRDVAALAGRHFADAAAAMAHCSRRAMRPAAVMGAFYRATLDELLRAGWRDPTRRVGLSKGRKLWLVLRHGFV
jgi:phytoene synthase